MMNRSFTLSFFPGRRNLTELSLVQQAGFLGDMVSIDATWHGLYNGKCIFKRKAVEMKFGLKCKVKSNSEIGKEQIQATVDGIDFTLVPSEEGMLSELTVVVGIDNDEGFIANIEPSVGLTIDYNRQIYDDLMEMVQYLEASLSFLSGVKKIYWDEAETIIIPENDEERTKYNVTNFSVTHKYPEGRQRLTVGELKAFVQQKSRLEPYTVTKLFHRDGMTEFGSFRYIQAFYNFYFVLEDLYGEGKTQNKDIEQKFRSNQQLRDIIQNILDTTIKTNPKHLQSILNFLQEENKNFDIDGIIELIVRVRGNLHHFSRKSTKRKGTPLNQGDFECMAYLLMGISSFSIIHATYE